MVIRKATIEDAVSILELFKCTIRHINSRDYSQSQVEVWADVASEKGFQKSIKDQFFIVSMEEETVTGFSSLDSNGYLDYMYVHKDHQRKGIANSLLIHLEKEAKKNGITRIWASVSITAQPFFRQQGFTAYANEHKKVKGIPFTNALMEKTY